MTTAADVLESKGIISEQQFTIEQLEHYIAGQRGRSRGFRAGSAPAWRARVVAGLRAGRPSDGPDKIHVAATGVIGR